MKLKKSTKKFLLLIFILSSSSLTGFFFLSFFKQNIEFYIETDALNQIKDLNQIIRIGGLVQQNSIEIFEEKKEIHFKILDKNGLNPVLIVNKGLGSPPIFKENSGIIVKGKFDAQKKIFYSFEMIGKHDENYMPPSYKK
jgi:cytochrome c-type biogenesis protein CcmE